MKVKHKRATVLFASFCLAVAAVASPVWAADARPDLTGHWVRNAASPVPPPPAMTRWGAGQVRNVARLKEDVERWCLVYGLPTQMERTEPLVILQDQTEVLVLAEHLAKPRHIYTTVTQHPSPDVYDATTVGHSIGKWEGDALVVDTVGFLDGIGPAGAPRTEQSHLVERFRLTGPSELTVQSTWTDPKALTKPYTWTWTYARAPAGTTAREYYCDPRERSGAPTARGQ